MSLDRATENMLWGRMANGDKGARERLIQENAPLAISIATKMSNANMETEDLIAAAFVGLVQAVDSYNPEKSRFSTYATFVIRGTVLNEMKWAGPGIRVPDQQWRVLNKLRRNNNVERYEQIAQEFNINVADLVRMEKASQRHVSTSALTEMGISLEDTLTSDEPPPGEALVDVIGAIVDETPQPWQDALFHIMGLPTTKRRDWTTKASRELVRQAKAYVLAKFKKHILMGDGE